MFDYKTSARVTRYGARAVMAVMAVLIFTFPMLTERYHQHFRPLADSERIAILAGFYACATAVIPALWNLDKLLGNILKEQLFTNENVQHIRIVRWCCLAVSIFCLLAAIGFPALIFLSVIMAFLCLVVTVVGQAWKAAVAIREENDLTV